MLIEKKFEGVGIAYIKATYNNTVVHITDLSGNTIAMFSGGEVTKQSRLKANPTIAMFVAKKAAEKAKDLGIKSVFVRVKGKGGKLAPTPGPGANAAIKSLGREGLKILNIVDTTPTPRGGPKPKGGKRGRRV
jgi:small subunit ribosomal protein S11